MSVHAVSWAFRQKVGDAGAKLVLIKLADQANDRGECWPSQRTLADECEMSPRTVQRKLELLYALKLVASEQRTRENGSASTLLYKLTPVRQSDAPPHDTGDVPPTTPVSYPEPSLEPTSPSEDGEGDADAPRDRDEIWDFLEETFGSVGTDRRAQAHQKRNKACADLKRLGATPDALRHALVAWPQKFPGATVTDIALATHYPQLTTGYVQPVEREEPEPIDEAAVARAAVNRAASEISRRLRQGVCSECSIGGGKHTADCTQARETPRRAYRRFIEETADFPLADVEAVIATWSDVDDVERQEFRDLAEQIRNQTPRQEAA